MKKFISLLAILLAALCFFTACGEKAPAEDPSAGTGTPDAPVTPDEPKTPDDPKTPGEPTAPIKYKGVLDMTDDYTLVAENGSGKRAAAGKIEIGVYENGVRTKGFEFDFTALGLEGSAWEYLGVSADVTETGSESTITNLKKFKKTAYIVPFDTILFPNDGAVRMDDGSSFDIPALSVGSLGANHLLAEDTNNVTAWAGKTLKDKTADLFKATSGYYYFVKSALYKTNLIAVSDEAPAGYTPVYKTVTAVLDIAPTHTMVIEKTGTIGDERVGVLCDEGKVCLGLYNGAGTIRTDNFEVDFASFGLDGQPWEYLGSPVELEVCGSKFIIKSTPVRCTYFVACDKVNFVDDTTVQMYDGRIFKLDNINYGMPRPNNLIHEGGFYIPKWNDLTTVTSRYSPLFTKLAKDGYFIFAVVPSYEKTLVLQSAKLPDGYTIPEQ